MPYGPARICDCGARVPAGKKCACQVSRERKRKIEYDKKRPSAAKRGYNYKWYSEKKRFLKDFPFCKRCEDEGKLTMATIVHHKIPHRGDEFLFWDKSNWEATCEHHHNVVIQSEEKREQIKLKFG